ncbi:IS21 family transposase, partial [Vibrio parahaemolyticus]
NRDFKTVEEYESYLRVMTSERNNQRKERLDEELKALMPLPSGAWDEAKEYSVSVTAFSTITVDSAIYSVPSRFISVKL